MFPFLATDFIRIAVLQKQFSEKKKKNKSPTQSSNPPLVCFLVRTWDPIWRLKCCNPLDGTEIKSLLWAKIRRQRNVQLVWQKTSLNQRPLSHQEGLNIAEKDKGNRMTRWGRKHELFIKLSEMKSLLECIPRSGVGFGHDCLLLRESIEKVKLPRKIRLSFRFGFRIIQRKNHWKRLIT